MKPLTIVAPHSPGPLLEKSVTELAGSPLVERIVIVSQKPFRPTGGKCSVLVGNSLASHETLKLILKEVATSHLLLLLSGALQTSTEQGWAGCLQRLLEHAESTKAGRPGLVYSDFYDIGERGRVYPTGMLRYHPLNDYQPGSVRDDFDFGRVILISMAAVRNALKTYGAIPAVASAALYDLRLKLSIDHALHHVREPLYSVAAARQRSGVDQLFAYVDPRNEAAQREMETVFTGHLKRIGAYLAADRFKRVTRTAGCFPVEASVVIPVRNRNETIADAVKSALSQRADFPFNVIVVDNHSTDGTTALLSDLAKQDSRLNHIVPTRTDLAIGGCWNEALRSEACGRYAVQLDSDDLYESPRTLQKIVDLLHQGNYAMVIGSYTLVDFMLKPVPPGLIDHREWTDENGRNNALRVNGLGAPRAFNTALMRSIGFLDVSYGEDYAAALRICREYRIGRIYENLYLCRRWPGNTDASLSIEETNRNDAFKDRIRSDEILARQEMNRSGSGGLGPGSGKGYSGNVKA